MAGDKHNTLFAKVEALRKRLTELVETGKPLTDPQVLDLSRQIDLLIGKIQRLMEEGDD